MNDYQSKNLLTKKCRAPKDIKMSADIRKIIKRNVEIIMKVIKKKK